MSQNMVQINFTKDELFDSDKSTSQWQDKHFAQCRQINLQKRKTSVYTHICIK